VYAYAGGAPPEDNAARLGVREGTTAVAPEGCEGRLGVRVRGGCPGPGEAGERVGGPKRLPDAPEMGGLEEDLNVPVLDGANSPSRCPEPSAEAPPELPAVDVDFERPQGIVPDKVCICVSG
jgi:hypothetical protein